jgi:hypothetical protein
MKPAKATCRVCPAMNYRSLRTLLEAVAITICLSILAGHKSEIGITSQATTNGTVALVAEQNSHCTFAQTICK